MKTNRAVIIQCRLSSTRLPEKAIRLLGNKTVLEWVLNSMHNVKADRYFVATDEQSYPVIKDICKENHFECFAGSLEDVLKRYCDLIKTLDVKTIIRATADNPFLFYEAAEESVNEFEQRNAGNKHCDYLTYSGLPHGSGVEIFSAESLLRAAEQTTLAYDHEHVGPALYNHKDTFKCEFIKAPARYNHPLLRTTIDTYSDYLRAVSIVNYLGIQKKPYTTEQILEACNSKKVKAPVVLVPSTEKGHGTGHLHRCLSLAKKNEYFVYIPENKTLEETDSIVEQYIKDGLNPNLIINKIPDETYTATVITDTFALSKEQLEEFSKCHSLISIDEGSQYSDYCDYLLDIIPSCGIERKSNHTNSSFIELPKNKRTEQKDRAEIKKILICLGGEDPSGLTVPAAQTLKKCMKNAEITAIVKNSKKLNIENVEFIEPVSNLKEKLYEYDMVITHYGLTAFEAMYAGCAVILLPTTPLHKKLAQTYNFAYLEQAIVTESEFEKAIESENLYPKQMLEEKTTTFEDFLQEIANGQKNLCPVCGTPPVEPDEIVSRNETRTYRRCKKCNIVYMSYTTIPDKKYQKSYFFEDYKKQYGKTYQEDFESIKKQGLRRLDTIKFLSGTLENKNVLDIGCAYGPFLSALAENKANPYGTDISEDAVTYVRNELHFPASCAAFPDFDVAENFGFNQFDVITMWYVIEHFKNVDIVLRKINSILKKNGIFAFSTPSGEGISAKSDKDHFYQISPSDHYTVWEPTKVSTLLKNYGFEIVKIVSTGHHPERFPSVIKNKYTPDSIQWKMTEQMSKAKKLGDTVEIYCKKIK